MSDQEIITQFQNAIANLYWISESDYPWEIALWKNLDELSPDLETPIKTIELERFFSHAIQPQSWHNDQEKEEVRRYQELVQLIKEYLSNITVYRVGETEVDIYIIGQTQSGNYLVLATKSVET
jgi:hypothetical protein